MDWQITLQDISKKYLHHYIIKDFSYTFQNDRSYAILGANGSGKSTLVKMLSTLYTPTKGTLQYTFDKKPVPVEKLYQYISLAAPWSDMIEDLTLRECISFHFKFRKCIEGHTIDSIINISGLQTSADRFIHQYSSGMKQRVRLLLAFFTQSNLILLDEPTSNLDAAGKAWYRQLVKEHRHQRMLIIASNHITEEYDFCDEIIEI